MEEVISCPFREEMINLPFQSPLKGAARCFLLNFRPRTAENYRDMNRWLWVLLFPLVVLPLQGEVLFSGLDLSPENKLLFQASVDAPGYDLYGTLFKADLLQGDIQQLTFFPEELLYLDKIEVLQFQNRFGVFRSDRDLGNITPLPDFPAFVNGGPIQTGKLNLVGASPDGNYILYSENSSVAFGNLLLYNVETGKKVTVAEDLEQSLKGPSVSWSPDSRFFIYAKGGEIFYYSLEQLKDSRIISEEYRGLGKGNIRNVDWSKQNDLYLLDGSLVYRIISAEIFTRALYAELFQVGDVVGKIPFSFDPNFDSYWISPDGKKILLNKGGRNLFIYYLEGDDFLTTGETRSLPYLFLPRNSRIKSVVWSTEDLITVLTGSIEKGDQKSEIFRLNLRTLSTTLVFDEKENPEVQEIILSPNEDLIALVMSDSVIINKYESWTIKKTLTHPGAIHALWRTSNELIIAGSTCTELHNIPDGSSRIIALSQPGLFGWEDVTYRILVFQEGTPYIFNRGNWSEVLTFDIRDRAVSTEDLRVYLEEAGSGPYQNMVMVRDVQVYSTDQLFSFPPRSYEPFPEEDEVVDDTNFIHGSRIRRREVALVFNAIDSVEGLTEILTTLREYGIRATFFINGDFIHRHPEAVTEIADSGHEMGSLFYVYFNMTDSRFRIDKDFIKRGLGRNEDDFFNVTGRELSAIWHAPYYFVSSDIIEASREMNYIYIGRDVDPLDWIVPKQGTSGIYLAASEIVERIIDLKKPGSIIPIRIGETGRNEYLFQSLDVLINGLIARGYDIVPVSTLRERAK
jgi:peptidoglycan/xylan/chitin deacetylase (PgdA/CDA1 family)